MSKMSKYPSIEQLKGVVYAVNRAYNFIGLDAKEEPMYDPTIEKPTLRFHGTVNIHGTNAGVGYHKGGMWAQSRKNVITMEKDNAGFALFFEQNKEAFLSIMDQVKSDYNVDTDESAIILYGEWAGKGIQKGVAISELPKAFYMFGIKVKTGDETIWLDSDGYQDTDHRIYNIEQFPTFDISIDFKNPELSQNEIVEKTIAVEDVCPVAKGLGVLGVGEGIVFTHVSEKFGTLMFKSKGEKHSKSRVKVINKVDDLRIQLFLDIASQVTPVWRLDQFFTEACDLLNGGEISRSKLGDYIRLVMKDIMKEDSDVFIKSGVEPKDVNKHISKICRKYFFMREAEL